MDLVLVRHGHAENSTHRPLSARGRHAVRATAKMLGERFQPTEFWTSPLTRALQTAELLASGLGFMGVPRVDGGLQPDGSSGELLDELQQVDPEAQIVIVTHEPFVSEAASVLSGANIYGLHPASAVAIRLEEEPQPGRGKLLWHWNSGDERLETY